MKKLLILLPVLLAISGYLYYHFTLEREDSSLYLKVSGNIETTEVDVGFKTSGRIISLSIQEGDWVEKGTILARLDDQDLRDRLGVAQAALQSAQARLNRLLAGSRPEEIREAEAAVRQAQYDLEYKRNTYERMKALYERRVIPKEMFENAETGFKIAAASLERAKESYELIRQGPRKEDIDDAKAQVEQARASLKLVETQLGYTVLHSPISGVVLVKSGEVGEVVSAGTPIVTLADLDHVWLKAYVSETDLGRIAWGQEVIVTTDLFPPKEYRGKIAFISSQAEFTPKSIQTEKERVTLVYRIKVNLPNPHRELKPGMPAEGRILLGRSQASKK